MDWLSPGALAALAWLGALMLAPGAFAAGRGSPSPHSASPAPNRASATPAASPASSFSPSPAPVSKATAPGSAPVASTSPAAAKPAAEEGKSLLPWILGGAGAFAALWLVTVLLVRRDLRHREVESRFWSYAPIALPIIGYGLYELFRAMERKLELRRIEQQRKNFEFLDADHKPIHIEGGEEEASGIENAKDILEAALRKRASDVHIEPFAQECRVRMRIDGLLHMQAKFTPADGLRLVSALKTLAQLDIAERRKAQDGRFGGRSGNREVDFRAATTPSVYGEKLVLRILDRKAGLRGLEDLGMPPEMKAQFEQAIRSRSGMILATGPTGSGKTSTLYAALTQLNSEQLNLVTIEDPVEYELEGATQIPVNPKAGVTYESGLRSILRQDPDVILVGEMRDLEAGRIALRSALTGHLVFTSLHTRDAIGTLTRLEEMGIERHLIASSLLVIIAQRLVRVLCPNCRHPQPCVGNELADLGIEFQAGDTIFLPNGCKRCEGSGYTGRTGVFEMLVLDDALRQAVNDGMSAGDFTKLARSKSYRSYFEDGATKVLLGVTSVEEVLKAA